MDPVEKQKRGGQVPFKDLTNTINGGGKNDSSSLPLVVDAKERKRQRERERFASMSAEQRDEKNKRRRELRRRMKEQNILIQTSKDGDAGGNKENMDLEESDNWLHRNETYQHHVIETGRDNPEPGVTTETVNTTNDLVSVTPNVHAERTKSRSNYFRKRNNDLTPGERIARQERERLRNTTFKRKESKKAYKKRQRDIEKNTLNPESIAMENPKFTPELVWPTADASDLDLNLDPVAVWLPACHRPHRRSASSSLPIGDNRYR